MNGPAVTEGPAAGRQLYAVPPEQFVAARTAAVAAARKAGDEAAARRLAALRKPTIAAWMVNLLAIRRPDLIAELVDLAAALRGAQRELRGPQLRELSAQRRAAVAALVAQARELAVAADPAADPARLPLADVEQTLTAALSDPDVAHQLRAGQLTRTLRYAGFGEVPRPQLRLVTSGPDDPSGAADTDESGVDRGAPQPRTPDRAAVRRELMAARTARARTEAELDRAATAERDTAGQLEAVDAELAALTRHRAEVAAELDRRKLTRRAAERTAAEARRRYGAAEAATEAIEADGPAGRGPRSAQ